MQPNVAERAHQSQYRQKQGHDRHALQRQFSLDDLVFACNLTAGGPTWLPGIVVGMREPLSCDIRLEDGHVLKRHVDHVRIRPCEVAQEEQEDQQYETWSTPVVTPVDEKSNNERPAAAPSVPLRHSTQERRPPDRYQSMST